MRNHALRFAVPTLSRALGEARAQSDRFVVAPEHVAPDVEVVVNEYPEFWLVEKRGEAEEIAEELE